jgi:hypothetical protein
MRTTRQIAVSLLVTVPFLGAAPCAWAQSLGAGLFALLTEQTPPPAGYVRDRAAAEATFATVAALFSVELTSIPMASSSGGFVYRFSPKFGTVERASDSFGPFFSERAVRNGRGQLSFGLAYQLAHFSTLQGADLTSGAFPTNTARFINQLQPFSVDTLSLELDADTVTTFASYGISDRLDVGIALPLTQLHFSGQRVNTFNGQSSLQSAQARSASGLGDLAVNVRYRLTGSTGGGIAVGSDLRFPTGREEDLLGTGKTAWRLLGIGSWEHNRWAAHGNGGFGVGGLSREAFWSAALTFAAGLRVSLVGELMGRRLSELNRVADVYQPHPVLEGVETMRWLPSEGGVYTGYVVTGLKWNPRGNWLVNTHVLTRLTDSGLRARFTPAIGLEYAYGF